MASTQVVLQPTSGEYLLSRSSKEASRLNDQHIFWARSFGYLIHPHVEAALLSNAQIADLACGTGAWAIQAARKYPDARLDAIDISTSQFPVEETPPANIIFSTHDIRQPFNTISHSRYDLVHIRAVVAGMNKEDWVTVIANVLQILKPGGFLQWGETDLQQTTLLRGGNEYISYTHLQQLLDKWDDAMRARDLTGPRRLPGLLEDAGAVNVMVDIISTDRLPQLRSTTTMNYITAILGWAANDRQSEHLQSLLEGIKKEVAAGAYLRFDVFTIVARRPI